jgi:hypothetical protein
MARGNKFKLAPPAAGPGDTNAPRQPGSGGRQVPRLNDEAGPSSRPPAARQAEAASTDESRRQQPPAPSGAVGSDRQQSAGAASRRQPWTGKRKGQPMARREVNANAQQARTADGGA